MLNLSPAPTEPTWIDLMEGVRLQIRPRSIVHILVSREAAGKAYIEERDAGLLDEASDLRATTAMVIRYARAVIADWSGIGDTNGDPAPVTPENVDALMARWDAYERFDQLVFTPALNANAGQSVDAAA
ncbi:hypothetical protein [Methylobacterium sp. Leaf91]|uniref:hypothetical protein n=1 Tax=Methylobacterium sp. Leaf91 TaxID=1736247 RepID=UPI0007019932|nr:hypothetical protein [Methylobacterium sp. Leaf91]KQO93329.1 hypothetical protein ASF32_03640 [Methylobacterium sp. Leaf91]